MPAQAATKCGTVFVPEALSVAILLILALCASIPAPFNSTFYERDPALSKERINASIPSWLLGILCALLPALVLLGIHAASYALHQRRGWLPLHLLLGLALALLATMLATNAIKNVVGSKRPNFFDLCQYATYSAAMGTHDASSAAWAQYLNLTTAGGVGRLGKCAGPEALVADAQRSFPSGHSSLTFSGMAFTALALRAALGVRPRDYFSPLALACGCPLALAAWVAATRVRENWHREIDVTAGAVLGCTMALMAWGSIAAKGGVPPPLWEGRKEGGEAASVEEELRRLGQAEVDGAGP